MKIHWMSNTSDNSLDGIRILSDDLDQAGYHSVLLTYDSKDPDRWIKAARVLNKHHKIKYMPAIRTYSMSPEYCVMLSKGFNEIQPDRLILNILSGHFTEGENRLNNTVYLHDQINSREKMLEYTDEWLKKYVEISKYQGAPQIGVSGHSKESMEMASKYADYHLVAYNHFEKLICKKNIICVPISIGRSIEELKEMAPDNRQQINGIVYGSEQQVIEKLLELRERFKDVEIEFMFWGLERDRKNFYKIHNMSKKLMQIP